jgi:hypothetical protein
VKKKQHVGDCDCGRPCNDVRYGCDTCRALDGTTSGEARVIAALRIVGKAAPFELSEMTGLCQMQVGRILKRLRQRKRVEYLGFEVFVFESNRHAGRIDQSTRHYYELRSS